MGSDSITLAAAPYSAREELANALTHGLGAVIACVALVFLIVAVPTSYSLLQAIGVVVYGASLLLMFLASTFYHAVSNPKAKMVLKRVDHSAIYLLIAGSYTPMLTIVLDSTMADVILIAVWAMALIGVGLKMVFAGRFKRISTAAYLAMGWISVLLIYQLYQTLSAQAFALLVGGGLAYSVGAAFYLLDRIPFNHAIWHGFVLVGAFSHCWLMLAHVVGA